MTKVIEIRKGQAPPPLERTEFGARLRAVLPSLPQPRPK